MAQVDINGWAVVVAAVVNVAIGALWYAPFMFGRVWTEAIREWDFDVDRLKRRAHTARIVALVGALVSSFVLAHMIDYLEATTALEGMKTGAWIWLGFVASTAITATIYEGKSMRLYLLNISYYLVAFVAMGAILAAWG